MGMNNLYRVIRKCKSSGHYPLKDRGRPGETLMNKHRVRIKQICIIEGLLHFVLV